MEIASEENCQLVSDVYTRIMENVHAEKPVSDHEQLVFQVELLSQEANSGASFEQYFRWVGKPEVDGILGHLQTLGLSSVSEIVQEAIHVAFPNGVPDDEDEYESCTEWTEAQDENLSQLFERFEDYNGVVTNKLAGFIRENQLQ